MTQPDLIDAYLDALLRVLRVDRGRVCRILAEVEGHLRQAVAEEEATGLSPVEAQRRAIDRFGTPGTVARRFAAEEGRLLPPSLLLQLVVSLGLLAGIGLAAIGVSGLLAAGMGAAFSQAFVAGDAPGVTYTPDRCADFFEYHTEAGECAAAVAHHFDEADAERRRY
jgi:hypothetical protein